MVKVKEDMTGWKMWEHGVPDSRLTVIKQVEDYVDPKGRHRVQWLCECNCEQHNKIIVRSDSIKNGATKSCGCLNIEKAKATGFINGINNGKTNKYDLSGEYGIGWTGNTNREFYFDLEDYDKIKNHYWNESTSSHGYTRLVACKKFGDNFESNNISITQLLGLKEYDHIDKNPFNNRKDNLRQATKSQQCINRNKFKNNTSGYIGISWVERDKKWTSYLQIDHKMIHLGYYIKKEDAIKARLEAEAKYFGELAQQKYLFEEYKINIEGEEIINGSVS